MAGARFAFLGAALCRTHSWGHFWGRPSTVYPECSRHSTVRLAGRGEYLQGSTVQDLMHRAPFRSTGSPMRGFFWIFPGPAVGFSPSAGAPRFRRNRRIFGTGSESGTGSGPIRRPDPTGRTRPGHPNDPTDRPDRPKPDEPIGRTERTPRPRKQPKTHAPSTTNSRNLKRCPPTRTNAERKS
jgi:hypothetical protein